MSSNITDNLKNAPLSNTIFKLAVLTCRSGCETQITYFVNKFGRIEDWNTSQVTDMSWAFNGATEFNQDISKWDTSQVIDMSGMFSFATEFNQDIGKWDTSKVTNMSSMFSSAKSFNQYIGKWDVSQVTDMRCMFSSATSFNNPISLWDVSQVRDMRSMFFKTTFDQDITNWNVWRVHGHYEKKPQIEDMFRNSVFRQTLGEYKTLTPFDLPIPHRYRKHMDKWFINCGLK
jgi:surface protein